MSEKHAAAIESHKASYPRGPLLRPVTPARTWAILTINFLAYAFVNAFVHYLSSGSMLSTTAGDYKQSMGSPFGEMLLAPLDVFSYPWLILVVGLLLAAIVTTPLLVACLYRSRAAIIFLFCPVVLGHAPVLTLVLAVGCVLVAGTVLRRRNPMLAMLLGLLPAFVYLYFSAAPSSAGTPMRQLVFSLPFLLAAVGAILMVVAVLLTAHWTKYVPGVICPVLVALAATPVVAFHYGIGADELAFSLISSELTVSEDLFPASKLPESGDFASSDWPTRVLAGREVLTEKRQRIVKSCEDFLQRYPQSSRCRTVLWIWGIALDSRLSLRSLEEGYFSCYDTNPHSRSREIWQRLLDEYPQERVAAVAAVRLAIQSAANAEFELAVSQLDTAGKLLDGIYAEPISSETESDYGDLFRKPAQLPSRQYLRKVSDRASELRWLIVQNDALTNTQAAEALSALLNADREQYNRSEYTDLLMLLAERFVDTPLADNIQLADIMDIGIIRVRAMQLKDMENIPGADASIQANFELGRMAMRTASVPGMGRILGDPEIYFKRICSGVASNPWRRRSEQYLLKLQARKDNLDSNR